jgi:uncharacterized protein (TIGR02266 family)
LCRVSDFKLRVVHPAVGEIVVPLGPRELVVGRQGGRCDLEMNWDHGVSRRHARFWVEGDRVVFEDMGSKNGTWDGKLRIVGRQTLEVGRVILVGESRFSLAVEDQPPVPLDPEAILNLLPPEDPETLPGAAGGESTVGGQNITIEQPPPVPVIVEPKKERRAAALIFEEEADPLPPPAPEAPPPAEPPPAPQATIDDLPPPAVPAVVEDAPVVPDTPSSPPVIITPPPGESKPDTTGPTVTRVHPRFLAEKKVALKVGERSDLRPVWTENISKGGLFVKTETPPQRGTIVEVVITSPEGEITLRAEVVHVVDVALARQINQSAGVGLQFVSLSQEQRSAISRYVDGIAEKLEMVGPAAKTETDAVARASVERTLARAKTFIQLVESNQLYKALEVASMATQQEINNKINDLRKLFANAEPQATPPQVLRLKQATKMLERAATLMGSTERRLEYDFRVGDVRAEERIKAARDKRGPSLAELRGIWHRAHPDRLDKATVMLRKAIEAKKNRDLMEAIRNGRAALELDPFHEELRQTVNAWQSIGEKSPAKPE